MKQIFNDMIQFIFFLIAMTALGIAFFVYAIYTLFYYMLSKLDGDVR